jgi:hypothetical protein
MTGTEHVRELTLRRFLAAELAGGEAAEVESHAAACPRCRGRLKDLADEQKRFEQEISFDRFAAGVERAARTPNAAPRARRLWWLSLPALGLAAAAALAIVPVPRHSPIIKGGAGITVQIAAGGGAGAQRTAAVDAPEALRAGDRVRIGYQPGDHRYVTSLSIDEAGAVTPLYPEAGRSLPVGGGKPAATRYFPDSVEFTGRGRERLIVILGDQALEVGDVAQAARAAYRTAGGDLARLPPLAVPGEQFQRTFVKP